MSETKETSENSGTSVLHETSEHWQNRGNSRLPLIFSKKYKVPFCILRSYIFPEFVCPSWLEAGNQFGRYQC